MTPQSHCWAYTLRKPELKETHGNQCSLQHCLLYLGHGSSLDVHRWMDKKVVVHIHNGILLSYKKECTWVSSNEVDEPRVYYTECSVQYSSVAQSCPTLCDPMNRSTPGLPVHHHFLEFTQTHVHRVGDAIQSSHPLSSPFPPAPNPSQHQSLFQWVNSSHEVAKVLEFQLQHHSLQRNPRADLQNGLVGSPCSPRTLKSLLQHHSSKASIFRRSAFFTVHLSHPYMTTG